MTPFFKRRRYYNSLSMVTVRTWREVHETGDLSKLQISGSIKPSELQKCWHKLNNEFLKEYGLDKDTKRLLKLRFQLASAMVDYMITGKSAFHMESKLLRADIEAHNKKAGKGLAFIEVVAMVERTLGFQIDEDKTTVKKFYSYLKQIKEQSRRQQEKINTLKNG